MIDLLEKTVLAGVGALALGQKKAEDLLAELREKFNLSEDEGRSLIEKLKQSAEQGREQLEKAAREEVQKAMDRLGVVSRDDFDKLKKKVASLEKHLKELKS
ncbi:phasin family protein [Malonomonas rubra]|uniref:phasin family protein n=1 Tax=Malonomonas rubra TaxID=57040 RepID=UPI0026EEC322|nr:phasin family protein [Malonomonas rubra]